MFNLSLGLTIKSSYNIFRSSKKQITPPMQQFFKCGLLFSDWPFIITIFAIGYSFVDRKVFALGILLYCASTTINAYLKTVFQIPINPLISSSSTWAFPSGHTQAFANTFLYISWHYRKPWLWALIMTGLCLTTSSMVYFGYHTWSDILGGCIVAAILVSTFLSFKHILPLSYNIWKSLLLITTLLFSTYLLAEDTGCHWVLYIDLLSITFYITSFTLESSQPKSAILPRRAKQHQKAIQN